MKRRVTTSSNYLMNLRTELQSEAAAPGWDRRPSSLECDFTQSVLHAAPLSTAQHRIPPPEGYSSVTVTTSSTRAAAVDPIRRVPRRLSGECPLKRFVTV